MSKFIDPNKLDRLAEVAVKTGLNLQPGQDLVISAPMEALPLVRRISVHAYKVGAGLVTPFFADDEITLARFEHARDESFDRSPDWLFKAMGEAFNDGAARLAITGDNPMLLAEQDPSKVARINKAQALSSKPAREPIAGFKINWSGLAYPGAGWAACVFPDLPVDEAQGKLMDVIYEASRLGGDDPTKNWAAHTTALKARLDWLNEMNFASLKYSGPGTDLMLGLADDHRWKGGSSTALNGVACVPNIPTEEVFTCPHATRVDGTVSATKPLAFNGALIEDISVRFEAGRIVEATASKGQKVLQSLLDTDEGASRIGEVALVPHSSPISQSGILFFNTLFDENAACHIALGQSYADTVEGGKELSTEELLAKGANQSLIHVDWMIGSSEIDIDGITKAGKIVPVMRKGEWTNWSSDSSQTSAFRPN